MKGKINIYIIFFFVFFWGGVIFLFNQFRKILIIFLCRSKQKFEVKRAEIIRMF